MSWLDELGGGVQGMHARGKGDAQDAGRKSTSKGQRVGDALSSLAEDLEVDERAKDEEEGEDCGCDAIGGDEGA